MKLKEYIQQEIKRQLNELTVKYKKSDIRSINALNAGNGGMNLTPVFNGSIHPIFVNITKDEYKKVQGDKELMKDLAIKKLNESKITEIVTPRDRWIPNDAEKYKTGLDDSAAEIYTYKKENGKLVGIAFRGRSNKPAFYYSFPSENAREKYIQNFIETLKKQADYKSDKLKQRKELKNPYEVGDIFYSSWGYDQTNASFYQVIDVKNKTITLREVGQKTVDSNGIYANVVPVKDKFVGQPFKKLVTRPEYISINSYAVAKKWDGKPKHSDLMGR